jgi:hypothetical protein
MRPGANKRLASASAKQREREGCQWHFPGALLAAFIDPVNMAEPERLFGFNRSGSTDDRRAELDGRFPGVQHRSSRHVGWVAVARWRSGPGYKKLGAVDHAVAFAGALLPPSAEPSLQSRARLSKKPSHRPPVSAHIHTLERPTPSPGPTRRDGGSPFTTPV